MFIIRFHRFLLLAINLKLLRNALVGLTLPALGLRDDLLATTPHLLNFPFHHSVHTYKDLLHYAACVTELRTSLSAMLLERPRMFQARWRLG